MPVWTLEDLDRALQGEPDKGRGADKAVMTDARRLPPAGRQALAHLYNLCEAKLGFPWQCMLAITMLQPKQKGDRASRVVLQMLRTTQQIPSTRL
eukprot:5201753-Pyramimonas_sp.AAC.1